MDSLTHGRKAPDPRGGNSRNMLRYGLWLRLATAGGFVAVGAAASLVEGPSAPPDALVAFFAGAVVVVFAYRRAKAALDAADASVPGAESAPAMPNHVRPVRSGRSADAIRSRGALAARNG